MPVITLIFPLMSIKKLFSTLFLILILTTLKGQQIEIRPSVGMGAYAMSALKDLMQQAVIGLPFNVKTTENFPAYAFYQLDLVFYSEQNLGWGFTSGFYSTGARNHYADYSGYYKEDLNVSSVNLGIMASQKMSLGHQWQGYFEFATGIKYTNITYLGEIQVGEEMSNQDIEDKCQGWWATPQLRFGRQVYKNFGLSVFAGYEFMLNKNLKSKNGWYGGPEIDWSGLRAGVSLSFIKKE